MKQIINTNEQTIYIIEKSILATQCITKHQIESRQEKAVENMVQLSGSLVTQWNQLYPGVPFPTPSENPQMFPSNFVIKSTVYNEDYSWWNELQGDCAFSKCCPNGYTDYQCQYNNNCYLNLANLGLHVLGFVIGGIILLILLGYATRLAYKCVASVAFIMKLVSCLGGFLKCFTLGVFDENVYYKNKRPKAELTSAEKRIISKTAALGLKVIISRLDEYQKTRISQVFEDYQVIDDAIRD